MPSFSPALYRDERALFGRRFLQGFHGQSRRAVEPVLAELEAVAERLRSAPPVLLHRDLQSSNILVRGSDPALIDFQGMRLGPAAYDLASLLFDPYVTLSAPLRDRLLAFYAGFGPDAKAAAGLVWWAAVQRLVQALGAYGKLVRLPGGDRYARHMDTAIGSLREVLPRLGHPFPRFRACLHGVSEAR